MARLPARTATAALPGSVTVSRLQARVWGVVQGVGFRPFVYRLASELGLLGWVRNDGDGVVVEVEGTHDRLIAFLDRIVREKPVPSLIYALDHRFLKPIGFKEFKIVHSESAGPPRVWVLPDLALCAACRNELLDSSDRRFHYPFTNCTHCGPRFTIIEALPYDRPSTTMKGFVMCSECGREYEDPLDRRFHAQPNACPVCGPRVTFSSGTDRVDGDEAIDRAVSSLKSGQTLALKGIGGYHLLVDAGDEEAVDRLRVRKRRRRKALAVMFPDVETLRQHVQIPPFAETLLTSSQAPILLLPRLPDAPPTIAEGVAPGSPYLGVFLPYTPLHAILLHELGRPLVATSGNLSEEPIVHEDDEAVPRLGHLCDAFLVHDRPIARHADDSVVHFLTQPEVKPQILRRARGYAPLPVLAGRTLPPILAVGGHQNVTFALSRGEEVILSQHLGDMESLATRTAYKRAIEDFVRLYEVRPQAVAHDLHPDYYTTHVAEDFGLPLVPVQHHHAHLAACLLENQVDGKALGIIWDGTGYGTDGTVWGGEFLLGDANGYQRVGSLFPFRLPGGERAVKEPWRVALSLLAESYGEELPPGLPLTERMDPSTLNTVWSLARKGSMSPVTSSMGRLFDGVSALLGLTTVNTHDAEAAQQLEYAAWRHGAPARPLPYALVEKEMLTLDWRETVRAVVEGVLAGTDVNALAAAFHATLVHAAVEIAMRIGQPQVALAGGVFCNRRLTESLLMRFAESGHHAFVHSQLPPTDGSLSAGQLWVAAHQLG